jgi:hypothetical protein
MYLLGNPQTGAILMDSPRLPPVFLGYIPSWHVFCTQCGLPWDEHPAIPGGRICRITFVPGDERVESLVLSR